MREADLREARLGTESFVSTEDVDGATLQAAPAPQATGLALSVVIPTKNEAENVEVLVRRLERVVDHLPFNHRSLEVVFVDDSDDDTALAISEISSPLEVRLVHRTPDERAGGLGGAVVAGMRVARAPWVCVMDADLQHPPEVIEQLLRRALERSSDLVVASRFCEGGELGSFSLLRRALSRLCSSTAAVLFPRRLRGVTDPLSGFFLVRREALELDSLRPHGFKILLEVLVRTPALSVSEVPFSFGERHAGQTKASAGEAARYLSHLWKLRLGELPGRFGRFGVVGATGLAVNMVLLAALADVVGLYYLAAAILATQGSTLWNFALTELWVFSGRHHRRSGAARLGLFMAVNNAALLLRVPLLFLLTTGLGVHYLLSNLISLLSLTVARYALADVWIWARAKRTEEGFDYDIHGIVTVASEVRLPELERFRVAELLEEPGVRVRIGALGQSRNGHGARSRLYFWRANGTKSSNGSLNGSLVADPGQANGSLVDEVLLAGNGHGPAHSGASGNGSHGHENGNHNAAWNGSTIRYAEGRGRFGFAVEIEEVGERIEVLASPLLRRSPHVLYTNVVEPILRWTFARKGYALVHAACFAVGERAFMLTARTDTGKTTTTLKTLDRHPYSFISDDLTILCPDGRVLTYPKPLTISRHTVQAVRTPLLSRMERAALVIQSRLHSRSGRRFALVIAKLRLPAATINAVVQLVVPPPKYHVERLIPTAKIAPEAKLSGLVVIQRGGTGHAALATDEALEILLENCEDAYGFPPYAEIEGFLHSRNGHDLQASERETITRALENIPATLLRSETMDWWQRMDMVVNGNNGNHQNGASGFVEGSANGAASGHEHRD